jgi:hypothetical protein
VLLEGFTEGLAVYEDEDLAVLGVEQRLTAAVERYAAMPLSAVVVYNIFDR